jgi:threonine/homoserine/homoserine lactone efflux protein
MRLYEVVYMLMTVVMIIAYCVIGVLMASQRLFFDTFSKEVNIGIGVAFVAYGLFRGWRTYQQITNFREN